jgi:hypothetical protein
MYCCGWLEVYRTGAGYILYVLLWVAVYRTGAGYILYALRWVDGSLPDRCWLYSVCTAVGGSLSERCWLFSVWTALGGWESTGQVLALFCMYCCGWMRVYRTGAGYILYVLQCVGGSLTVKCWLYSVRTAVGVWDSTGDVLAIFCLYCCGWLGVYRRGSGYILYVLLWEGGSLPERFWLYSVYTAVGGWESAGEVLAVFCMYCCGWLGVYRRGSGYILYVLLWVVGSIPERFWLYSVCTAVGRWESTGKVLAIFCMYCCGWVGVDGTGAGYVLYVLLWVGGILRERFWLNSVWLLWVVGSLRDRCWLYSVCTAVGRWENTGEEKDIFFMYRCRW